MLNQLILKMEKRNGLREKVRKNLPIKLVGFLKKEGILCKFMHNYITYYLSGYIERERALMSDIRTKSSGEFLIHTFLWANTREGERFWKEVYQKYLDEYE